MTRHKHLKLDQSKLDRARRLFKVRTESEAVERALDIAIGEAALERQLQRMGGMGGFEDPFGEEAEIRRQRRERR